MNTMGVSHTKGVGAPYPLSFWYSMQHRNVVSVAVLLRVFFCVQKMQHKMDRAGEIARSTAEFVVGI